MITIEAPWPGATSTLILPNPELNDGENLSVAVTTKRAMDGTLYTYVKTSGQTVLLWDFRLTLKKLRELRGFLLEHYDSQWRVKDYRGDYWLVKLLRNPIEMISRGREMVANGRERWSVTLELEGQQV